MRKLTSRPQQAHEASTSNVSRSSFLSCPCTKGDASASVAQAAYSRSPVLNVSGYGVRSTVTG